MLPKCLSVVRIPTAKYASDFYYAPANFMGIPIDDGGWTWEILSLCGPLHSRNSQAELDCCVMMTAETGPFVRVAGECRPIDVADYNRIAARLGFYNRIGDTLDAPVDASAEKSAELC